MDKAAFLLEDAREIIVFPYLTLDQLLETANILFLRNQLAIASFYLLFPGHTLYSSLPPLDNDLGVTSDPPA